MKKAYYNGLHDGEFFLCGKSYDVVLITNHNFKVLDENGVGRWVSKVNKFFLLL
jgi:hypothetical protein